MWLIFVFLGVCGLFECRCTKYLIHQSFKSSNNSFTLSKLFPFFPSSSSIAFCVYFVGSFNSNGIPWFCVDSSTFMAV
jgi:hypothetical protein